MRWPFVDTLFLPRYKHNEMVDVILGLQWGDEGKGKIVDYFAKDYDVIARFQGGTNAGHTLYVNDQKVVSFGRLSCQYHQSHRQWRCTRSGNIEEGMRYRSIIRHRPQKEPVHLRKNAPDPSHPPCTGRFGGIIQG